MKKKQDNNMSEEALAQLVLQAEAEKSGQGQMVLEFVMSLLQVKCSD